MPMPTASASSAPARVGYYLATAFDEIHLQPLGALGLTGILIETPLLRGLLDKLGIQPSGDKRGAYKNAADMFTDSELSPAHASRWSRWRLRSTSRSRPGSPKAAAWRSPRSRG